MPSNSLKIFRKLYLAKFANISKAACKRKSKAKPISYPNSDSVLHPKQIRLKELQRQFQKDDGLPVHMKTPNDRMLVRATYIICAIGMFCNFRFYYELVKS